MNEVKREESCDSSAWWWWWWWWWVKFEIGQIWKYEGDEEEEETVETASIYTLRWICFRSNLIKLSWWHSKFVYPAKFSIWFTSISLFKTGRMNRKSRRRFFPFVGWSFLKGVVSPRFDSLSFLLLNGAGSHTDNFTSVNIDTYENFLDRDSKKWPIRSDKSFELFVEV